MTRPGRSDPEGAELTPHLGVEPRRALPTELAMVHLQPDGEGGDKEEEEQQSGHGSNLSTVEVLPPVANMPHCERKLPRHLRPNIGLFRDLLFTLAGRKITF